MPYTVEHDGITTTYSKEQLVTLLVPKAIEITGRQDTRELVVCLADGLKDKITQSTIEQLINIGFGMGYAYRVFKDKNNAVFDSVTETPPTSE